MRVVATLLPCFLLAGCAGIPQKAKPTDTAHLESLESDSSYHHLVYHGSDEHFHYFRHFWCTKASMHQDFYKIERAKLNLEKTFPLDEGEPYVAWPGTIARAAAEAESRETGTDRKPRKTEASKNR
jgi:hypothetical protein